MPFRKLLKVSSKLLKQTKGMTTPSLTRVQPSAITRSLATKSGPPPQSRLPQSAVAVPSRGIDLEEGRPVYRTFVPEQAKLESHVLDLMRKHGVHVVANKLELKYKKKSFTVVKVNGRPQTLFFSGGPGAVWEDHSENYMAQFLRDIFDLYRDPEELLPDKIDLLTFVSRWSPCPHICLPAILRLKKYAAVISYLKGMGIRFECRGIYYQRGLGPLDTTLDTLYAEGIDVPQLPMLLGLRTFRNLLNEMARLIKTRARSMAGRSMHLISPGAMGTGFLGTAIVAPGASQRLLGQPQPTSRQAAGSIGGGDNRTPYDPMLKHLQTMSYNCNSVMKQVQLDHTALKLAGVEGLDPEVIRYLQAEDEIKNIIETLMRCTSSSEIEGCLRNLDEKIESWQEKLRRPPTDLSP